MEERLEFSWEVLEERKYTVLWMFVAERVEYEALFGNERVAVGWNPVFS
jgi:hypothetical protein